MGCTVKPLGLPCRLTNERIVSLTLVTGPSRSGKSSFAEALVARGDLPVVYVATARAYPEDSEWVERLARHIARRPATWRLIETAAPNAVGLAEVVRSADASCALLVDSLGGWLADRMSVEFERAGELDAVALEAECDELLEACVASRARIVAVGEETGWGIVPEHRSARVFRDALGRLSRRLAREAEEAYLVVSGFAVPLRALAVDIV